MTWLSQKHLILSISSLNYGCVWYNDPNTDILKLRMKSSCFPSPYTITKFIHMIRNGTEYPSAIWKLHPKGRKMFSQRLLPQGNFAASSLSSFEWPFWIFQCIADNSVPGWHSSSHSDTTDVNHSDCQRRVVTQLFQHAHILSVLQKHLGNKKHMLTMMLCDQTFTQH